MTFVGLVAHNVWTKKAPSLLTGAAIAIGVMVVITLGIVTESLKTTAASNLQTGRPTEARRSSRSSSARSSS